jgi:OHCU decarboxylase
MSTAGGRAPHELMNTLAPDEARQALELCCGSARWVSGMLARRPFSSADDLYSVADDVWRTLSRADFLEAFACHPRIGDTTASARGAQRSATSAWSAEEQARAVAGPPGAAETLRALNDAYFARFGYIFIICATGKTAAEIVAALRARLANDPGRELGVAAAEQARITRLRLEKLAR